MTSPTIVDAGPLVALFDRRDRHHDWAKIHLNALHVPPVSCEPVITEACFLLRRARPGSERLLLDLMSRGRLIIAFDLDAEIAPVSSLMARYANVPMSLADACLVRMAEIHADGRVLTLDGDFRVYCIHGKMPVPATLPGA